MSSIQFGVGLAVRKRMCVRTRRYVIVGLVRHTFFVCAAQGQRPRGALRLAEGLGVRPEVLTHWYSGAVKSEEERLWIEMDLVIQKA